MILSLFLNFASIFWCLCSLVFVILDFMTQIPNIPPVLWDMMTFGKANVWGSRRTRFSIEQFITSVPKRLFWHFYLTSIVTNGFILWQLISVFFLGGTVPQWYITVLENLTYYPVEKQTASHLSVLIAIAILTLQGIRRLYECFFVSSYSNSTMHVLHYILGMIFYPLTGITIITEGPNLLNPVPFDSVSELFHAQLQWYHIVGVALFLWATVHHYRAHVIFANLRHGKDKNAHLIPYGDWFELVSCPHYLSEILIYVAVLIILGGRHFLAYQMLAFVMTNQIGCGLTSHQWYVMKFEDYPKQRHAIIPWIL